MADVIDIPDQAAFDAMFADIVREFNETDWRPWQIETMRAVEREHSQMFAQQRAPSGEPWKPLAPATIRRKGHQTILVDKTPLLRSLTEPNGGIREMFQDAGKIGLIFGTDVPYSVYHLRGGGRLPKRDHVGLPLPIFEGFVGTACDHALKELAT